MFGTFADSVAVNPPGPAGLVTNMKQRAAVPPVTVFGEKLSCSSSAGGGGGRTVTVTPSEELLYDPVIVAGELPATPDVVAVAVPLCTPAGTVSGAGHRTTVCS